MIRKSLVRMVALGVSICLAAAALVGANRLLDGNASTSTAAGGQAGRTPASPTTPPPGGVIVLGTVGPDPIPVGPPAVAALATVTKVLAKEGETVEPGAPLVQFDDRIYRTKLDQARAELRAAEVDLAKAGVNSQTHQVQIELQEIAIKSAQDELISAENVLKGITDALERVLTAERNINTNQPLSDAEKQRRRDENPELQRAKAAVSLLQNKVEAEKKKLDLLKLDPIGLTRDQAAAKVERLKATVAEAETAVDLCLVRAPVAGTLEQVLATPGMTYGPSTRTPLVWMVPSGNLIVRAEVEAEFASRVAGSTGKSVTVYDHNNFAVTYEGTVARVGTAFLPKRTTGDTLSVTAAARVLECIIDVPEPAPSGRPPLRIGQPVRVAFP